MKTINKNILWGVVTAIVMIVFVIVFLGIRLINERTEVVESDNDRPVEQMKNQGDVEGNPAEPTREAPAENMGADKELTPEEPEKVVPSIETTSHTVYIGFAEDIEGATEPTAEEVNEVVVGYEWEALPRSQMFASVILPEWDTENTEAEYLVESWDEETESYISLGAFPFGEEINFPRDGFVGSTRFKVTGIDPKLRICPGERSFTWVTRFTFDGRRGLVRTPITEILPPGQTCTLK